MKKQTPIIFIILTLLINLFALPVSAVGEMTLTVSEQSANPGEEITVTISVDNNPGLASLKFDVAYDSMLTLKSVTFDSAFGTIVTAPEPFKNPEPLTMISPLNDITANGVFATLTFVVSDDAEYGYKADITISYLADDIYDGDYTNVPVSVINGYVMIECPHEQTVVTPVQQPTCTEDGYSMVRCEECGEELSQETIPATGHNHVDGVCTVCGDIAFLYGDCNGDGKINGKDATRLLQYLANYDPTTGESTVEANPGADCNGDGKVNGKDATRLLQYLANYDPDTGESSTTLGPKS